LKIRPVGNKVVLCGQTDGHMDRRAWRG